MGRVIKGSPANPERYALTVPPLARPIPFADEGGAAPGADGVDGFYRLGDAGFAVTVETEPPPLPEIDFDAIAAQAQAIIDDAMQSAERLVDEARERAQSIVEEAAARGDVIGEEARSAGRRAGYTAGEEAARDEASALLVTLREIVESAREQRHALLEAAEPELVRLAVGIAERVLHQQVALDGGVVIEMAKAAVARIVERERITVRVNPADVERMREHRDELLALGDVKTMQVVEDQRVDRGGVIIETDGGSIDAKISTQLTEVRKILHIVDDVVVGPAPLPLIADEAIPAARAS